MNTLFTILTSGSLLAGVYLILTDPPPIPTWATAVIISVMVFMALLFLFVSAEAIYFSNLKSEDMIEIDKLLNNKIGED